MRMVTLHAVALSKQLLFMLGALELVSRDFPQ
jgi:hypothetical protein